MDEGLYKNVLDHLFDGVYFVDTNRVITYWNRAAETITGFTADEVIGSRCQDNILRHVDDAGTELCIHGCPLANTLRDGEARESRIYLHHKAGHRVPISVRITPIYDEHGTVTGAMEIFSDHAKGAEITQRIEELQRQSLADALTGVGNRRYADMTLESLLRRSQFEKGTFGLLFIDLDHFKQVNDTHGHTTGDRVLVMVARTVSHALRDNDIACRWGGDEFVIFLPLVTRAGVETLAERLRILIEQSWVYVDSLRVGVTASVGATVSRPDDDAQTIIDRADSAVYESKEGGRNTTRVLI